MPQIGEVRTGKTESVRWDGNRWQVIPPQEPAGVEMHHPGLNESPDTAYYNELGRTGKEALTGLVSSPIDAVKGFLGMVRHPIDAVTNTAHAVAHPVDTVKALGDDPRAAGSLIGQILLGEGVKLGGPKILSAARDAAEIAPEVVGEGVAKTGRAFSRAANSRPATAMQKAGGYGIVAGHPIAGAAGIIAPEALDVLGQGMEKGGESLKALKLVSEPPKPNSVVSGITLSPDAVARNIDATNMAADGFSRTQAGKLSGIPGAGRSEQLANINTGTQIPEFSVNDVLNNTFGTRTATITNEPDLAEHLDALKSAAAPRDMDAMQAYEDYAKNGPGSGKQSFTMGGTNYVPDESGSHVAVESPVSSADLQPDVVEAEFAKNNPAFKKLEATGMFGGDRTTGLTADSLQRLKDLAFNSYVNKFVQ